MSKLHVVEKHPLWLRISHWLNVPFLGLMIWSGILIYWANDVYPGFFPNKFYEWFSVNGRLAEGLAIHFTVGWLFFINAVSYVLFVFVRKHYRELFPSRASMKLLVPTILDDLGLRKIDLPKSKFNAAQRLAYTGVMFLGFIEIATGFAIYKPVQLRWLLFVFGGYEFARLIHFVGMILFTLFILMHIAQVVRAGWNNFRAMVAGFEVEKENGK